MAKKPTIERSIGTAVTIGRVTYGFVGAGYEGKTKELDDFVQEEAKILAELFGRNIEIRFNSDRESGGAWIKDGGDSTQVGLNAKLVPDYNGRGYKDFIMSKGLKPFSVEADKLVASLPKKIHIETGTKLHVLRKGVKSKYPEKDNMKGYWRYGDSLFVDHKSIAKAKTWLKKSVNPKRIKD